MHLLARPNVWMFVMLACAISWVGLLIPEWFLSGSDFTPFLQIFLFGWGPAAAAVVMKKWVYSSSIKGLGWNRKYYDFRWITLTIFGPLAVMAATLGVVFLLGNVLNLPGFGRIEIGSAGSTDLHVIALNDSFSFILAPIMSAFDANFWTTFGILLGLLLLIGATVGLLLQMGSEMGFRGYLLRELQPLGFLGSNTLLGLLVGGWQCLMLLHFLPGWSVDYLPVFLSILGYNLALAFPLAWLSLKTRSVYASATFSSVLSQVSALSMLFYWNSNPLLAGVNGMAGMIVLMIITGLILRFDKAFVDRYEHLVY
ncbi:MAG: hypothetical protein NWR72_08540 [Bacteroidia bacterium]|nr:hypothetical protein [Bacteroidia bacterium]